MDKKVGLMGATVSIICVHVRENAHLVSGRFRSLSLFNGGAALVHGLVRSHAHSMLQRSRLVRVDLVKYSLGSLDELQLYAAFLPHQNPSIEMRKLFNVTSWLELADQVQVRWSMYDTAMCGWRLLALLRCMCIKNQELEFFTRHLSSRCCAGLLPHNWSKNVVHVSRPACCNTACKGGTHA